LAKFGSEWLSLGQDIVNSFWGGYFFDSPCRSASREVTIYCILYSLTVYNMNGAEIRNLSRHIGDTNTAMLNVIH